MYDIPICQDYADEPLRATILKEATIRVISEEKDTIRDQRHHRAPNFHCILYNNGIMGVGHLERLLKSGEFTKLKGVGPKTVVCAQRILKVAKEIRRFQQDIRRISHLKDPDPDPW